MHQHTANQLMASLDLFSLKFRLIELIVSGESSGVYLLLEHPNEELVDNQVHLRSVLRRQADREGDAPEVKYSVTSKSDALADYEDFLSTAEQMAASPPDLQTEPQTESALADWLDSQMDVSQYLRWVALDESFVLGRLC